jgi:hypothetical protein
VLTLGAGIGLAVYFLVYKKRTGAADPWRRGLWRAVLVVALVGALYGALRSARATRASEPRPVPLRADAGALRDASHERTRHDADAVVLADAESLTATRSMMPSAEARDGSTTAPDAARAERGARRIRGRRADGGAAGIGRDPDF